MVRICSADLTNLLARSDKVFYGMYIVPIKSHAVRAVLLPLPETRLDQCWYTSLSLTVA